MEKRRSSDHFTPQHKLQCQLQLWRSYAQSQSTLRPPQRCSHTRNLSIRGDRRHTERVNPLDPSRRRCERSPQPPNFATTQNRKSVIDPSDHLRLTRLTGGRAHQHQPADHVDSPQLHRVGPLPPDIGVLWPLPGPRPQQTLPGENPVDRGRRGNHDPVDGLAQQLHPDPLRPPPRMLAPQLRHQNLRHRGHLMRTRRRSMRPVRQPRHPVHHILGDPLPTAPKHALTGSRTSAWTAGRRKSRGSPPWLPKP